MLGYAGMVTRLWPPLARDDETVMSERDTAVAPSISCLGKMVSEDGLRSPLVCR